MGPESLDFATPLAFNAPGQGFPWDNLHKILHRGQQIAKEQHRVETLLKISTG